MKQKLCPVLKVCTKYKKKKKTNLSLKITNLLKTKLEYDSILYPKDILFHEVALLCNPFKFKYI